MYKFTDKQRRQLLEDALVADLLEGRSSAQRASGLSRKSPPQTATTVAGLSSKTASA